jgi:hypothetical protein
MKKFILTTMGLIHYLIVFSQTRVCENRLDTTQVITLAKRHNSYWNKDWHAQPGIKFDEQNCTWIVVSTKSRHTNRGQCKHTNGCRLVKTVTLVINARSKKVLSRDKKKKLHPNYE